MQCKRAGTSCSVCAANAQRSTTCGHTNARTRARTHAHNRTTAHAQRTQHSTAEHAATHARAGPATHATGTAPGGLGAHPGHARRVGELHVRLVQLHVPLACAAPEHGKASGSGFNCFRVNPVLLPILTDSLARSSIKPSSSKTLDVVMRRHSVTATTPPLINMMACCSAVMALSRAHTRCRTRRSRTRRIPGGQRGTRVREGAQIDTVLFGSGLTRARDA